MYVRLYYITDLTQGKTLNDQVIVNMYRSIIWNNLL